jgi:radical SAM protein with 4Fe4S-binding SPASM domain
VSSGEFTEKFTPVRIPSPKLVEYSIEKLMNIEKWKVSRQNQYDYCNDILGKIAAKNYNVYMEMFFEQNDIDICRKIFKKFVKLVQVEISSFCNRMCAYCPVSYIPRKDINDKMENTVFDTVVMSLSSINYTNNFLFNLFNEPLADKSYFFSVWEKVQTHLPLCIPYIITNGDFLDVDYLDAIHERNRNGKGCVAISIHYEKFSHENLLKIINDKIRKLCLIDESYNTHKENIVSENKILIFKRYKSLHVSLDATNFQISGSDRGGLLNSGVRKAKHFLPCDGVFSQVNISHDGDLYPCCIMFPDAAEHRPYILGKITDTDSLFKIYFNKKITRLRRSLFNYGSNQLQPEACAHCYYISDDDQNPTNMPDYQIRKDILETVKKVSNIIEM